MVVVAMSSGASSSLSAEAGEFSDDGIDWVAAVDTLTETEKKMQAAAKLAARRGRRRARALT